MKVVLVNPPVGETPVVRDMAGGLGFAGGDSMNLPPLDLAYLAATLENNGHLPIIIDAPVNKYNTTDVYDHITSLAPDAIIANVSLPSIESDCSFIRGLRSRSNALLAARGVILYPTLLKKILTDSAADLFIYGESDLNIHEILTGATSAGIATFNDGEVVVHDKVIVEDLDKLPMPARHLLDNQKYSYVLLGSGVTTTQTSRGCPYPCAYYCPYPLVQGRQWRSRSPEHVYQEIENVVRVHNIDKILFRDATFTLDRNRTIGICDLIRENHLRVSWWCETRVDRLDEDLLIRMKDAGCLGINVGVETGDQAVMNSQAKKGLTIEKLKTLRALAEQIGLRLHFLLIMGLPMETRESLFSTYRLVRELKPNSIGVTLITPYPGTPLYEEANKKNWIETTDLRKYDGGSPVMHTDNLAIKEIIEARLNIDRAFHWHRMNKLRHKLGLTALDCYFMLWSKL